MTLLGKTPLIIAKEKVCQVSLTGCFVLSSLSLAYFSQRMKCELYEERQEKIIRRDKILELLESKQVLSRSMVMWSQRALAACVRGWMDASMELSSVMEFATEAT